MVFPSCDLFSVSFAIDSALNVSSAAQEVALAGVKVEY